MSTFGRILGSAAVAEWSLFEGAAALRCTLGVAIPLLGGLALGEPAVAIFGASGAVSVGFGSFQGVYRSRAAVMLLAAAGMAVSIFLGSVAGQSDAGTIAAAAAWGFAGGLLVALGPAASFVGLQSMVAVVIAAGYPADVHGAAVRAALVFGGGLVQTLLVVSIWPLRRFRAERESLGAAYRSLAAYADRIPEGLEAAPEPHTFAATPSPLADPQPFARSAEVLVFQALLDEGDRLRASLAGLATRERRLAPDARASVADLAHALAAALREIADALEEAREPRETPAIREVLESAGRPLSREAAVEATLGQLRAAWRTAGTLAAGDAGGALPLARGHAAAPARRLPVRDAVVTLRANLTLASTACRHALRLAATLALATAVYRLLGLPRGYWIPLTAVLVLKPEFHDTFARGIARIGGTLLGAAIATIITRALEPGPGALAVLVLASVWCGYALVRVSYAVFTVFITAYVVFLLMLAGLPELAVAAWRIVYTAEGGVLALAIYALWPTWSGVEVRPALAGLLESHAGYVTALLAAWRDPRSIDLHRLAAIRGQARLTRSNTEAIVERMLAEPAARHAIPAPVALGLLAAIRRHSLAALALHAGLERSMPAAVPGVEALARGLASSLAILAGALRSGTPPAPLPPLRDAHLALGTADTLLYDETDLMVDSVNTMAALLAGQPGAAHA